MQSERQGTFLLVLRVIRPTELSRFYPRNLKIYNITQTLTVTGETRGRVLHRASPIHRRLTWMSQETFMRLEHLRQLNSNRQWVNEDVYRLLYKEDLYILAYERIKSKPGNMTPETNEQTLNDFSLDTILDIIHKIRTQ